jgi:hypothetical protein
VVKKTASLAMSGSKREISELICCYLATMGLDSLTRSKSDFESQSHLLDTFKKNGWLKNVI